MYMSENGTLINPLMEAILVGAPSPRIVELLLLRGANPNLPVDTIFIQPLSAALTYLNDAVHAEDEEEVHNLTSIISLLIGHKAEYDPAWFKVFKDEMLPETKQIIENVLKQPPRKALPAPTVPPQHIDDEEKSAAANAITGKKRKRDDDAEGGTGGGGGSSMSSSSSSSNAQSLEE